MKTVVLALSFILFSACSPLILQPADFSWPIESVLIVNNNGFIVEERHTFEVNAKPIFYEEFSDSNSFAGKELRVICDKVGHFYFTGPGFKNVYLFIQSKGVMQLDEQLNVPDSLALKFPAFNQKLNGIELTDGSNKYFITGSEIVRLK